MPATLTSDSGVAPDTHAPEPRLRRYVAMGDSSTAGVPDDPEGTGRWPDELAAALGREHPDLDYHNLGVAGVTSREVVAGQLEPAVALAPDLVTLFCGANDVLLSVRPDIDGYRRNLSEIFSRLGSERPAAHVLTATCADFSPWLGFRPRSRRRVSEGIGALNDVTREEAARHGAHCLEFEHHPRAVERESFAADGVHPSRDANRRAAAAFLHAVSELRIEARPETPEAQGGP